MAASSSSQRTMQSTADQPSTSGATEKKREKRSSVRRKLIQMMKKEKLKTVKGEEMSLWNFAKYLKEEKKWIDAGFGRDRDMLSNITPADAIHSTPGQYLRQHAQKMQLRPEEEAQLGLNCFGRGVVYSPRRLFGLLEVGKQKDFVFGLYAKPLQAEKLLKEYRAIAPAEVLTHEKFYRDIVDRGPGMEMTAMIVASRDLPLVDTIRTFATRARADMEITGLAQPKSRASLQALAESFSPKALQKNAPWSLADGNKLKAGTHVIFGMSPKGGILAEAISGGALKDRRQAVLGLFPDKVLTRSVFRQFLGPAPLDPVAALDIAGSFLYIANGFRFHENPNNSNQYLMGEVPDAEGEWLPPHPAVFNWSPRTAVKMLLHGTRSKPQRAAAAM